MQTNQFPLGSAIPGGWSVGLAREQGEKADASDFAIGRSDGILLGDGAFIDGFGVQKQILFGPGNFDVVPAQSREWPVRDQAMRSTCTAFAVIAAEEIWQMLRTEGNVTFLSEEFLYAKTVEISIGSLNIDLEDGEIDALTNSGATFLLQAMHALQSAGVCERHLAPYDKELALSTVKTPTVDALTDAQRRISPPDSFVHNIVNSRQGDVVGLDQKWTTKLQGKTISQIILEALQTQVAVTAAFAVLGGIGRFSWLGVDAAAHGVVSYPLDDDAALLDPIGGHAVCIIGFVPDSSDATGRLGWFFFRNSYGSHSFGRDAGETPTPPNSPVPGYGMISTADVDRYCWEYLFRRAPPLG